jgi:predicted MPP superfamily phosphohydrolase
MKIKLVSDLHLEFADIDIKNDQECDVLILSGYILVAYKLDKNSEYGERFRNFLSRVSSQFPHVVYVAGNHEFYSNGQWVQCIEDLRTACSQYSNMYFLERDTKTIDDVVFVGGTLWTDMNKGDPLTLQHVKNSMNDYRTIRNDANGYTTLKPNDTVIRHRQTLEYIKFVLSENVTKRCVVVGHHSPSFASAHDMYKADFLMNGAYHSELSEFILDHPQIKLWTHGHTHHPFDYCIGATRVVCNPRGYDGYEDTGWNEDIVLEV